MIHEVFDESRVFRIDHYLGKETVQNILVFRFANSLFERAWNRDAIEHIQITVAEPIGVETRGAYYEESGAIRDILQNHHAAGPVLPRDGATPVPRAGGHPRRDGEAARAPFGR